jgi:NAD(P)-dependent dehydrogenase (short-subunit alcohol dehydrogenase family)
LRLPATSRIVNPIDRERIMNVTGKVILITGAARGLGFEYATSLGAAGAHIVGGDVLDCAIQGGVFVKLDVSDMASVEAMVAAALDAYGRIDGLVNNAALYGSLRGGRFNQIPEQDWDAAMTVNVKGIWNCCKAVVPAMRQGGGGSIVNISSLAATYGMPFALHYTTSKAAVIGLTRGLARELGRDNIRVNAVAPSAVMTEGTREFMGERVDRALQVIRDGQSIQRTLEPGDLSGTIAWLLSDASAFVTGQTIAVDGGTVML